MLLCCNALVLLSCYLLLLLITYQFLLITSYLLLITYYSLRITYYLILITYYLLIITYHCNPGRGEGEGGREKEDGVCKENKNPTNDVGKKSETL